MSVNGSHVPGRGKSKRPDIHSLPIVELTRVKGRIHVKNLVSLLSLSIIPLG
jgi:hypothetical protein